VIVWSRAPRARLRFVADAAKSRLRGMRFSREAEVDFDVLHPLWSAVQPVLPSPGASEKVWNIQRANVALSRTWIEPGEVFSFWRTVGMPSLDRGYRAGRMLRRGKIVFEAGGGLCQLSSLIYIAALELGFEVLERHAHSVDLYSEGMRAIPIGRDAAVVFGYKDLKFRNVRSQAVAFRATASPQEIMLEVFR
jgi:vancomycin resistance protein VanW